jgi:hypothetical protein
MAEAGGGPPAHWLATVRARAPWLLGTPRPLGRPPRRQYVPPVTRYPLVARVAGTPGPSTDRGAALGVYKEGKVPNATADSHERRSPGSVRPASAVLASGRLPEQPAARARTSPEPDRGDRPAAPQTSPASRPDDQARKSLLMPPLPAESSPARRGPGHDPGTGPTAVEPKPVLILRPPQAQRPGNPPGRAAHQSDSPPPPDAPAAPPDVGQGGSAGEAGRFIRADLLEPARLDRSQPATATFLPPVWDGRTRENVSRTSDAAADAAVDDRWPQLPEWEWQSWQMNPIQRQLREWARKDRLTAEQAGSSWSGLRF